MLNGDKRVRSGSREPNWPSSNTASRVGIAIRQDLLRGGAKIEIMSWGTNGELQGRMQRLLDDQQFCD